MTTFLILLIAALAALLIAYASVRVSRRSEDPAMQPEPAPEPVPMPEPRPDPVPAKPGNVRARLESAKGRKLADIYLTPSQRRPKLLYRLKNGELSEFVLTGERDGRWIYRRVGVEREA